MTNKPLLFDLSDASCGCTDHALEELYKALSNDPDDKEGMWREHENLFIRKHVEDVTKSVGSILSNIQSELLDWLVSPKIKAQGKRQGLFKALESWRFSTSQAKDVLSYLESKPRDQYSIDDWMLVVDLIINKYLSEDVIQTEAEYLSVKSVLAGRVQAQIDEASDHKHIFSLVNGLPLSFAETMELSMSPLEEMVIQTAMARAAMHITDLGEQTRKRIKSIIIGHEEKIAYRDPKASQWNLQQQLLDEFGILNRDWRRVAITEIGENANQGFIGYMDPGSKVKRIEAYEGACPFCKKINGMVFDVVSPDKENKDGWKEVWLGKTNIGRSASPRKRIGDELVDRLESEKWYPAPGLQHPNCRGRWVSVEDKES